MFNIFRRAPKHVHSWELVAVNDEYHTNYTDTGEKKYWQMRFYKCSCGQRKFTDNRPGSYVSHSGMEKVKQNWYDAGVVPHDSYHPTENKNFVQIDDIERETLDPILAYQKTLDELAKSLKVVLNRDFQLEEKYPKLKEAADEYHRRLAKYKTFENMKEPRK